MTKTFAAFSQVPEEPFCDVPAPVSQQRPPHLQDLCRESRRSPVLLLQLPEGTDLRDQELEAEEGATPQQHQHSQVEPSVVGQGLISVVQIVKAILENEWEVPYAGSIIP